MRNCKKCIYINMAINNDKFYICDLTNDFIKHPRIKPWICSDYEKEIIMCNNNNKNKCCNENKCCKECFIMCSGNCCKKVKEEK